MNLTSVNGTHTRTFTPTQGYVRVRFNAPQPFSVANITLKGTHTDTSYTLLARKGGYRYAYNGMEQDNEMKGNGNSYTTEFRQYDPRLGRWLSVDPLAGQMPWFSPYNAMDNNPIRFNDPSGLKATDWVATEKKGDDGINHITWQWIPRSFNNENEAKLAGWDHWMGKGGVIENMHVSSGYVGPFTLLPDGDYEERRMVKGGIEDENDDLSVKPNVIDLTQNSQGWEPNPTAEQTKGMEVIPVVMEQQGVTDWWERQRKADIRIDVVFRMCDNLAAGAMMILCAPLALELAPAVGTGARAYHVYFGMKGGYASIGYELLNQGTAQFVKNGTFDPRDLDLIGIGTSAFIRKGIPLKYEIIQGASGGLATWTYNEGPRYPLLQSKNASGVATTLNGALTPLMGGAPIFGGKPGKFFNEVMTGATQVGIDKSEDK